MERELERQEHIVALDQVIRTIMWQAQKQSIQTLSRPHIDLTMPQMMTLYAIREAHICRMSELAEVTQQSAGTLTGIVDRLIDDGLVDRVRDAEDRRVVQVTLTLKGREKLDCLEQARRSDMAHILSHFNLEQLAQLEDLLRLYLHGINELIEAHGEVVEVVEQ
ncbi:MAG: MarR family transcriptional regulator [Chloroflexaceae bacterium]|nr:MarR family transcriptional regulator [Chloroflexaceae bacterium]